MTISLNIFIIILIQINECLYNSSNGLGKQLVNDTNSQINIDKIYCPIRSKRVILVERDLIKYFLNLINVNM